MDLEANAKTKELITDLRLLPLMKLMGRITKNRDVLIDDASKMWLFNYNNTIAIHYSTVQVIEGSSVAPDEKILFK